MNVPRYAAAAAKLLARHMPEARPVAGDREQGIAVIHAALAARRRRRRLIGAFGSVLAMAAAALLAFQLRAPAAGVGSSDRVAIRVELSDHAELYQGQQSASLQQRALLQVGERIETGESGSVALSLSTGTALELGSQTSFSVANQGSVERFLLQRGRLSAKVAKLGTGQRFIVATPDAEIEVRGTRFTIDVLEKAESCGGGSRSRLSVTEGIVEVRAAGVAALVKAGQTWPTDCGERARSVEPAPDDVAATPSAVVIPAPKAPRPSSLARANDLFAEAVALRRQGDAGGALRAFQEVVTRFPASPLAENAMVERMRLLSGTGGAKARSEAQRYLARYPNGFAVAEARKLAAKP